MDIERRIDAIARQQFGTITHAQLRPLLSRQAIAKRIATGRLIVLQHEIYAVGGSPRTYDQSLYAAIVAGGADATVSGFSAAQIWRYEGLRATKPDLLIPHERRIKLRDVRIRRSRNIEPGDIVSRRSFTVTSPMRTVIDLAVDLSLERLEEVLEDGHRRRLFAMRSLGERVELVPRGTPGLGKLRRLLGRHLGSRPSGSKKEIWLRRRLEAAGIPMPVPQYVINDDAGRFVARPDFVYPNEKLIIEFDGSGHAEVTQWEDDMDRQNALILLGYRILRITDRAMRTDRELPQKVLAALAFRAGEP